MTLNEFFHEVRRLPVQWKTSRSPLGEERVRCFPDANFPGFECCPITAMAWFKFGKDYGVDEYFLAARRLGLSAVLANEIATSADDTNCLYRREILQACLVSRALLLEETP